MRYEKEAYDAALATWACVLARDYMAAAKYASIACFYSALCALRRQS